MPHYAYWFNEVIIVLVSILVSALFVTTDSDTDFSEFRQEAYFRYLFALNEPNAFGAIDMRYCTFSHLFIYIKRFFKIGNFIFSKLLSYFLL